MVTDDGQSAVGEVCQVTLKSQIATIFVRKQMD